MPLAPEAPLQKSASGAHRRRQSGVSGGVVDSPERKPRKLLEAARKCCRLPAALLYIGCCTFGA
eukprot:5590897-Alexandrium_andersonii.AAC.1